MMINPRSSCLLILFICAGFVSKATHIFGADFYYEHLTGNNYKVSLAVYADCGGAAFPLLATAAPVVNLLDAGNFVQQLSLSLDGPGVEITPVCPAQINNTTCKGGTVPGVFRYIYSTTTTVPHLSADWQFMFTGEMISCQAGRSNAITNIMVSASIMVLEADLNNLNGPNSSPRFSTIPTPFYCVNLAQQYNQGAIDPDNDALLYSLEPAHQTVGFATYNPGFSPTNPMGLGPTFFSFNTTTGQMNFTPTFTQNATIVNKVSEYKNGLLVGTAMREMTFVIQGTCNNASPTGKADTAVSTYTGGVMDAVNNVFTVYECAPVTTFRINTSDPEGNNINVTSSGLPPGAVLNIANNNTTSPTIYFSWSTSSLPVGTYTFFLTYKDDGCPFASQQTQAFTVKVIPAPPMIPVILYNTDCAHKALVKLTFATGVPPRTVVIKKGTATVYSFTDNTGVFIDSFASGTYNYTVVNANNLCNKAGSFTVKDSGVYPYPPVPDTAFYCLNDAAVQMTGSTVPGGSIFWYDSIGTRLSTPPIPNTATAGISRWFISTFFNVCESRKVPIDAYVTKRPTSDITLSPFVLCTNDTATVQFSGSIGVGPILRYVWNLDGGITWQGSGPGPLRVRWLTPGIKVVTLQVLENKCPSNIDTQSLLVKPTPIADFTAKNVCLYDTMRIVYTADTLAGQQYAWSFNGSIGSSNTRGPFNIKYQTPGVKHILLTVSKDGCTDSLSKFPEVYVVPEAKILTIPATVCLGDKIYLEHSGVGDFIWTPNDRITTDPDGKIYVRIIKPITYKLTITNEFGCVDSDAITYNNIEPCCNFSYPNAFTPNSDGLNDVFRVVTYGNDEFFSLSIYNRWGQRVYHSGNPKEGWDGKVNGKDADADVYFYVFHAKCLTGYEENKKGDLTLVR